MPFVSGNIFEILTSAGYLHVFNSTVKVHGLTCFSEISLDKTLELERILMAVSSSRMLPSDDDNTSRILSSISFSLLQIHNYKRT